LGQSNNSIGVRCLSGVLVGVGRVTTEVERIRGPRWCDGKRGIKGGETFWLQVNYPFVNWRR